MPYPTDVSDDERVFAAMYLTPLAPDAPQCRYDRCEIGNALRGLVPVGAHRRYLPGDFPPRQAVSQQTRRWLAAGCFEAMV